MVDLARDGNKMNKYEKLIDEVTEIRTKNNKNWMDILRLAFKENPKEAQKIMSRIVQYDKEISLLNRRLGK